MPQRMSFLAQLHKGMRSPAVSMRRRLFSFLLLLTATLLIGIMLLLALFGVFPFGNPAAEQLFQTELSRLSAAITAQYGEASMQAVRLSSRLSAAILAMMEENRHTFETLNRHPDELELLLKEQVPALLIGLDATDCSGVFMALDTTINPDIPGAEHSKAGLYIRNTEPNISGTGADTRLLLRGPSSLATTGDLNMQAGWDLEFRVENKPFFSEPIAAFYTDASLPLSRLVYWSAESPIDELNENVMVCSVPILDEHGRALGVCGFEISQMNFMNRLVPDDRVFHNIVFLFSPMRGGEISLQNALFAGNVSIYASFPGMETMHRANRTDGFTMYTAQDGVPLSGMEQNIRLYPNDSLFAGDIFLSVLVLPKADLDAAQSALRLRLVLILLVLLALGICVSIVLSKRYVKPITDRLLMAEGNGRLPEKTNITEIDLLLERFRSRGSPIPENLFDDFLAHIKRLTPTEFLVFQAHAEGKSMDEMSKSMFISVNTLKKHNSHIYEKLKVSSQEELRLYINLLRKCGMLDRVFSGSTGNGGD